MGADQLEDYSTSPSKTPLLLEIITSTISCQRTVFFNTCATLFLEVCLEARPEACIQYDWLIFLAFVMLLHMASIFPPYPCLELRGNEILTEFACF